MMKTTVKPNFKSKTFCINKSHTFLIEKQTRIVDYKFYQKLFLVLISLSVFMIYPDSPRELANICESYNSRKLCSVW